MIERWEMGVGVGVAVGVRGGRRRLKSGGREVVDWKIER